jgi:hypothetical protein
MKRLFIGAAAAALAMPALAQAASAQAGGGTVQELVKHGGVMTVMGTAIPVSYGADGKYSVDFQGQKVEGTWRVDGDKLCTKAAGAPSENCTVYPAGKKSGDEFEVTSPTLGPIRVKIN